MTPTKPEALPEPSHRGPDGTGSYFNSYTATQMHDYAARQCAAKDAEISTLRRRKTGKQPNRESFLEELCNRQHSELQRMREENFRLRRVAQWIQQSEATRPAEAYTMTTHDTPHNKALELADELDLTRPLERDYNSFVSYARALEAYCAAKDSEIAKWKHVHEINADTLNAMQYEIDAAKTEIATLRAAAQHAKGK
jgi:hypothetical protein